MADLVGRVAYGGARVVLTRHGKPVAALVPVSDPERIEALEASDAGEFIQLHRGSFDRPSGAESQPPGHLGIAARHDGDLRPTARHLSRQHGPQPARSLRHPRLDRRVRARLLRGVGRNAGPAAAAGSADRR